MKNIYYVNNRPCFEAQYYNYFVFCQKKCSTKCRFFLAKLLLEELSIDNIITEEESVN